jgi:DNA-directed RNA polymerase specialized sigma24 family protein
VEVRSDHKGYGLTPAAFDKLLASLDPDRDRAGERYEEIRRGLVCLFEWRGAPDPADHADETLNRVARKLDEGTEVADPFSYVYGVARLVLLEAYKSRERERAVIAELPVRSPLQPDPDDTGAALRFDCLERCLDELAHESRDFLTAYYQGDKRVKIENRQRLADRLRIPLNALRLRARRAREKLEMCVETCVNRRSTLRA